MKKRLFLALCLVLAMMLTAIPAKAAGSVDAWITANNTSVKAGDEVKITVYAEVDNCGAGGIYVSFDSSVFVTFRRDVIFSSLVKSSFARF